MDFQQLNYILDNKDYIENTIFEDIDKNRYKEKYLSDYCIVKEEVVELRKITHQIADGDILNVEELKEHNSLKFTIIIIALKKEAKYKIDKYRYRISDDIKYIIERIYDKYKNIIFELVNNKDITNNLSKQRKMIVREIKELYNPDDDLLYTKFENYDNSLLMISFISKYISHSKKLTQKRADEILKKVLLINEYDYRGNLRGYNYIDINKGKPVILYCINNLTPYLSIASKKKLLKFLLEYIDNPQDIFFDFIKRYPDNYIAILFEKEFFIKVFKKFDDNQLNLFVAGIKENKKEMAKDMMIKKANIIAKRLSLYPNSGAQKIFLTQLKKNEQNDKVPYLKDIIEVFDNIYYNLQNILLKLGYSKDDY